MFEKRKLTRIAKRILEILPQKEPCFDMRNFPYISEEEIPNCANIFIVTEHLPSAVCAAYCYHSVRRKYGRTPHIIVEGQNEIYVNSYEILTALGVEKSVICLTESVWNLYSSRNLGENILVLLPLHASFKIKTRAMRWNVALIGKPCFINIRESFREQKKAENFFADLHKTVELAENHLDKGIIIPRDEATKAFRAEYYGTIAGCRSEALHLMKQYREKYKNLQTELKDDLASKNKQINKQKKHLIRKFTPMVLPEN